MRQKQKLRIFQRQEDTVTNSIVDRQLYEETERRRDRYHPRASKGT